MKIKEIISLLESWAPISYQESYDNSGLIVGDREGDVSKVLITLDCVESVVDEAISKNCQMIIAHHPIIFGGLKRLNGNNYVEKTVIKAIKNDIAIYAIHTNLDNISLGVNAMIAEKLGLIHTRILSPKKQILKKLITYIPENSFEIVQNALFEAGAGHVGNYSHCGFSSIGNGSFLGNENSNPSLGSPNQLEIVKEIKFETIFPHYLESKIINTLFQIHPYEEVAYDVIALENTHKDVGSGIIGELENEISLEEFLKMVKEQFQLKTLKYTPSHKTIKRVAICGGSGSFLRMDALRNGADVFLSSDFKYHEWFDAEGQISYIDIGHYESEQYTKELIFNYLKEKALYLQSEISKVNTNPVNYFI